IQRFKIASYRRYLIDASEQLIISVAAVTFNHHELMACKATFQIFYLGTTDDILFYRCTCFLIDYGPVECISRGFIVIQRTGCHQAAYKKDGNNDMLHENDFSIEDFVSGRWSQCRVYTGNTVLLRTYIS